MTLGVVEPLYTTVGPRKTAALLRLAVPTCVFARYPFLVTAPCKTDDDSRSPAVSWLVELASMKIAQSQSSSALRTSARVLDLALQKGECESR